MRFSSLRAAALLCGISLCGLSVPALAQGETVDMHVDTDTAGGEVIDRNIFGQFAEHLGQGIYGGVWVGKKSPIPNVRGIRSDVVAALKAIHVPNVRWPGGCFADEYHWRDGVGPASARKVHVNSNWGGVPEANTFGTDEFMDFANQIGADAYVSVNVGSGSPEEAGDWLEYMTAPTKTTLAKERAANGHPAPYKVAILGLGNENWGCGGAMSPDHYVEEMKRFAHYVHNFNPEQHTANQMKRVAVGWDSGKSDYTEEVMKAWASRVYSWDIEGVSLHNYVVGGWPPHLPATGFGEDDYAASIREAFNMDKLIVRQTSIMDKYDPSKKVFLSVDEWGAWLAPTPGSHEGFLAQQNSLRDAILAAVNLNIFARHADRVKNANIAQMINVLQAMILTDGPKMVLTPTYHIYHMYVPFQDATFVPVSYDAGRYVHGKDSMPRLDAIAARDKEGHLWLSLVNIDPNNAVSIHLDHATSATGQVLTAPKVDAVNTFAAPDAVTPQAVKIEAGAKGLVIDVPAKAVMVVRLD
ncbi:MAG: alpha-N-arabinofuranosidase [Sphingomonadales bacterium]|nr:alpha-N-arabinofuranosidase [Sphingomonadales bacterium]MDE2170322.1 alpha-N-arabinofuranosidase [Sphingomonadales bacterium]